MLEGYKMNESEFLIYHYSANNQEWQDITKRVIWLTRDINAWCVRFIGSDKYYHISFLKMRVFDDPKEVEFVELYYRDSPCYGVKKLLFFNNEIYKIFYNNGYTCIAFPKEIKIVKDAYKNNKKVSSVMAYYRRVVQEMAVTEADTFVLSQFDDISYINENSVLALYLNGILEQSRENLEPPIIYPFGLNKSQSDALKMAFANRISIIEGPPGTGKTQTILNIISNAVIREKSVAVVSNNNSATDNVFEKLKKYGYSFICAPLGNAENVDSFFDEYEPTIPELKSVKVDVNRLNDLSLKLPLYFEKENKKKELLASYDALNLEYKHFLADNMTINFTEFEFKFANVSPNYIQDTIVKLKEKEKIGFFDKFIMRRRLKISNKFFKQTDKNVIVVLQYFYYLAKKSQILNKIKEIEKYMKDQSLDEKLNEFQKLSNSYFKNKLAELYSTKRRNNYNRDNYKRIFSDFTKEYPVILSSTYALAKCSQKNYLFDYLIIDESSQVNMASAILSMRVAKNLIVVGDIKQLPQIDSSTFKERNKILLQTFNIPKAYSYYGNSIMSSLLSLYGENVPKQMLREHYRCAPEIINFCNKEFYNNELIVYTKPKNNVISMRVIKTVTGNHARKNPAGTGLYNQREIDEIEKLLQSENMEDVGIITPYRFQAKLIQDKFGDKVDSNTIHKFQGREKKTIIFSTVINDANDFVENDNLINVAVSRAIDKFILITSEKVANSKVGVLSDLINYISYNQDFGIIEEGNVKSIYDILYKDYEKQLNKFRQKHPSKDFDTENITKQLLKQILNNNKYKNLDFAMHVSLRDFIKNGNNVLTADEFKFYVNPNSHVDFMIFNKMSRKPILAIEVDGVFFHEQKDKQMERDIKKNSILEKVGIPILRLKTNESNEKNRIISAIEDVLK